MRTEKDNYFFIKANMFFKLINLRDSLYLKQEYIGYFKAYKNEKEKNDIEIELFETNFKIFKLQKTIQDSYLNLLNELKTNKYDESSNLFNY
jgi:hypothetical protein